MKSWMKILKGMYQEHLKNIKFKLVNKGCKTREQAKLIVIIYCLTEKVTA